MRCYLVRYYKVLLLLLLSSFSNPPPLISVGGGYYYAGPRHSGGVAQIEYKWGKTFFNYIRPQASLVVPKFASLFVGAGLAFELYLTDHFVISPNFTPGLYIQGKGRNLGYPLEFRSCFEAAYEWDNWMRLGLQFYHISNASLSSRNPGANALILFFGIPIVSNY